mgnify:CR=1 FL=1
MNKTIIYIGDFKESYSTERYIAHALETLGYTVKMVSESGLRIKDVKMMVDEIMYHKPCLVLFSKGAPPINGKEFIEALKKVVPTACWLFDLYFDLQGNDRKWKLEQKHPPFNVETIFSTDGGHDLEFARCGIKHKLLRQGIHEPEAILYERELVNDIVFVGGDVFKNRGWLLDGLKSEYGDRFQWIGQGQPVRGLELNELYASTKIVVGDSQPTPKYWSNRVYETLGRGGFLLHPRVEGMEEFFKDKEHIVYYERGNIKQVYELINYYLEHDDEREKIRRQGFELVKNHHTYKHRCIELMKNYE